jgi:hypothetical protein
MMTSKLKYYLNFCGARSMRKDGTSCRAVSGIRKRMRIEKRKNKNKNPGYKV